MCGTEIQLMIMKGTQNFLTILVKVTTGDNKIDNMIIRKELSEWVHRTRNLFANMFQAYNDIGVQCTTFTRSKLSSLSVWEVTSENSDLIVRMKGIKGLIFKHDNAKYLYMGMRLALRGFLNIWQVVMSVTEYHEL